MTASLLAKIAVAKNSIRHLNEADDHFKQQRFASALSSATLSIEETGKLFFLGTSGKNETRHWVKQIPLGLLLYVIESLTWSLYWQKILKEGLGPDDALSDELRKFISDNSEFAEIVARLRTGDLKQVQERLSAFSAAVAAKDKRDGTVERWRPWFEGYLHKMRMRATYVDVNDNGEIIGEPEAIKADIAEGVCGVAQLLMVVGLALYLPKDGSSLTSSLHDGLPGNQILNHAQEILNIFAKAKKQEPDIGEQ